MISHDNYTWITDSMVSATNIITPEKVGKIRTLSILPLSHVSAQLTDLIITLRTGSNLFFANPSALQGSLTRFLKICKP